MDNIFLSPIPIPELIERIANEVVNKLQASSMETPRQPSEYLSGKVTDEYLGISPPTRIKWAKEGILKKYQIGGKILYKRVEVEKALKAKEARRT